MLNTIVREYVGCGVCDDGEVDDEFLTALIPLASERLVQQLQAEDLVQADLPNVSAERAKELDDLMMRMTETDWLNLMMQVGSNPALARELLGADVNEENFIERMTAIKEKKKRALADLRYRALKGKPMKQSEVTQMMRTLVKNQWCAAHNGTITMTAVKAMTKQQLIDEYEYICRRLEKDRLLSAQYNLFRPKPVITEPPSKRQRVERATSQPASVPAATSHTADDPDSAGGGTSNPAGSAFGAPVSDSTVPTPAAMDSAGSHHESGVSPFADSADSSSPPNVSTDHIPLDVLFESTSGGINDFFLTSDADEQIGMSRVAVDPDSDDEVLAEILFRGKYISGAGVVVVDKLPDDEIVDPRVKVETIPESAASPPRSRRKHLGVRSDDFLWDKPVEDFFSSESESDDDMETYIPPLPYGAFKDWEIVRCPLRSPSFAFDWRIGTFGLNPEVDVGLDLGVPPSYCRDVVVTGNVIQTVQTSLRQSYECLASAPLVFVLTKVSSSLRVSSYLVKAYQIYLCCCKDWKLLFFDVATSFDSAVHRVHVVSFDAVVLDAPATVSAACIIAASYIVSAGICDAAGLSVLAVFINVIVSKRGFSVRIKSLLEVTASKLKEFDLLNWDPTREDMDSESAHMVAASKVPMLKPEKGNTAPKTTVVEGVEKVIPPTTAKEKAQKRLEVKAISTLMMGIPNEHQLKFKSIKDAKLLLEAIEKSLEMLDQTFDRLQKLVSQLEILGETISQEDVNQKLLRSLSSEWNTPKVNTAYGVSTASTQVNTANSSNVDNLSDAVIYAFLASQPNSP
ncbi:hypothetical protein Tco_0706642 [Tanacetum coccineum]|uniref:Uncharacterized protein n=1 Tax=Tanacetum coccineum TaxID=301880 RepID=A0ABQ4Y9J5_9ASTR